MHANFSNGAMRDEADESIFTKICENFGKNIERHMSVYGGHNEERLTGKHETQSIDQFSYGVSDRGASIRIPVLRQSLMVGKVDLKTEGPHQMQTLTKCQQLSSKQRKRRCLISSILGLALAKRKREACASFFCFPFSACKV